MLEALQAKYKAEVMAAKANIKVYLDNPVGIGEHSDLVSAVDFEITKLAAAEEKLAQIETLFLEISTS